MGSGLGASTGGFEQAALFVGKFLKAKALKKSDDEILQDFGAERESSGDDDMPKDASREKSDESGGKTSFTKKKGFGKMLAKVSKKQK